MSYRDDLTALAARHTALEHEVVQKTAELDRARQVLDEATTRARLPILDNIRVASPCPAEWSKMTGDDRSRHCGACKKTVYNLSNLTRDEAQALLIAKEGRLCARYFQRADGTILTKDCAVGVARKRRRRVIVAGAAAILAGASAVAYQLVPAQPRQQPLAAVELGSTAERIDVRTFERRSEPSPNDAPSLRAPELRMLQGDVSFDE